MSISSSGALATPLIPSAFSGTQSRDAEGRLVLRAGANPRGMQGYAVGR